MTEPHETEEKVEWDETVGAHLLSAGRREMSATPLTSLLERALESETRAKPSAAARRFGLGVGAGLALAAAGALAIVSRESRETITPEPAMRIEPRKSEEAPQPARACVAATGSSPLIDDFEDQDARLAPNEARSGSWFSNNDGTGTQTPSTKAPLRGRSLPRARGTSRFALETRGTHFEGWGSAVGVSLVEGNCYDASVYTGLTFWAKGPGRVELQVLMDDVVPKEQGGTCEKDCFASHAKTLVLDGTFRKYEVKWSELEQPHFGAKVAFDARSVRMLLFAVKAADSPYRFWIDDVAFMEK